MAPIRSSRIEDSNRYGWPILGDISERLSERLDVSSLFDTGLVNEQGYLIPGAVFVLTDQFLVPVSGGGQTARGILFEAVKVADSNSEADLGEAMDFDIVLAVSATIDRAIAEWNLDRPYTANELAAINANDRLTLTDPES